MGDRTAALSQALGVHPVLRSFDPARDNRMTLGGTTASMVCPATDSPLPPFSGRAYVPVGVHGEWDMAVRQLVTAEELERMGEQDFGFELVRGELVPVTPAGREHGVLTGVLAFELTAFVRAHRLGRVYPDGTGYKLSANPDTVRGPDVSFVSRERDATLKSRRGFIPGAPDLAVEIRSPDDTVAQLEAKAVEYLDAGTQLVWLVHPRSRQVKVHRPGHAPVTLSADDTLDGGDVLPGFTLPLARLFAELD